MVRESLNGRIRNGAIIVTWLNREKRKEKERKEKDRKEKRTEQKKRKLF